jgi:hypothetical protein
LKEHSIPKDVIISPSMFHSTVMPLHKTTEGSRLHLQQPPEQAGAHREYSLSPKEPYVDLRQLYAFSKGGDSGSSQSVSSHATSRSTSTCHASNTTRAKQEKKQQKREFRKFAKWLMKFLEKKDPRIFGKAQAVIRDCEQRKKLGEAGFESVTDSLKVPLRKVVGNTYWREARFRLHSSLFDVERSLDPISSSSSESDLENFDVPASQPHSVASPDPTTRQPLHRPPPSSSRFEPSPLVTQSVWNLGEESKIRRERFYIILRVLMKYLQTKNRALYARTKEVIHECCARNDRAAEDYGALLESIKRKVKHVVGDTYWRKAESYLSKAILQQARLDAIGNSRSRSRHQREVIHISPGSAGLLQQSSKLHENTLMDDRGMSPEEEPQGEVQEFFVNACQAFSSTAKRTLEKHAASVSTTASNFCFRSAAPPDSGSMHFDHKRRRLHPTQNFEGSQRI